MVMSDVMNGSNAVEAKNRKKLLVRDISRAYFYAPSIRPVYVKIVDEDWQPGGEELCGRLNVSMHGTRDAALNWHEHYRQHLMEIGFVQGKASLCVFKRHQKGIMVFMHSGD